MAKDMAVFGLYPSQASVEQAVANLRLAKFRGTDVSILLPKNTDPNALARENNIKRLCRVTLGAGSGACLGGVLGWLIGAGMLTIPGIGSATVVSLLAGIGAGGLIGGLIGRSFPKQEIKHHEGRLRSGILVSVHSDDADWARRAIEVLERTGAENIAAV